MRTPGWITLSRKAAEIAGLLVISRLIETRSAPHASPAHANGHAVQPVPEIPTFIGEVVDPEARLYRGQTAQGDWLFAGLYSDGRVRLAMENEKRFSGFRIERTAVMADLHEDVSFEMLVDQTADTKVELTMDGGPFDGQTLACEAIS